MLMEVLLSNSDETTDIMTLFGISKTHSVRRKTPNNIRKTAALHDDEEL